MWTRLASGCFVELSWGAPALRPNGAEMSRTAFLALVTCWCSAPGVLMLTAIVARALSQEAQIIVCSCNIRPRRPSSGRDRRQGRATEDEPSLFISRVRCAVRAVRPHHQGHS